MKILKFCRHKSGLWEGVIFENNSGKHYITNGIGVWEESEKRLEGLDIVHAIDIPPAVSLSGTASLPGGSVKAAFGALCLEDLKAAT